MPSIGVVEMRMLWQVLCRYLSRDLRCYSSLARWKKPVEALAMQRCYTWSPGSVLLEQGRFRGRGYRHLYQASGSGEKDLGQWRRWLEDCLWIRGLRYCLARQITSMVPCGSETESGGFWRSRHVTHRHKAPEESNNCWTTNTQPCPKWEERSCASTMEERGVKGPGSNPGPELLAFSSILLLLSSAVVV